MMGLMRVVQVSACELDGIGEGIGCLSVLQGEPKVRPQVVCRRSAQRLGVRSSLVQRGSLGFDGV